MMLRIILLPGGRGDDNECGDIVEERR